MGRKGVAAALGPGGVDGGRGREEFKKTRYGRSGVSATPVPLGPMQELGVGWESRGESHNLFLVVSTACSFLQVTPSQTGHRTSPCPARTSPCTCGLMRSSSVSHAFDLLHCSSLDIVVNVCLCTCVCLCVCVHVHLYVHLSCLCVCVHPV